MHISDFDYHLPPNLIAHYPLPQRTASRLLCLDGTSGQITHRQFADLLKLLQPKDLLVVNDTRVIPARILGHKITGGKIEILIERLLDSHRALVHLKASKTPKPGSLLQLDNAISVKVIKRVEAFFEVEFQTQQPLLEILAHIGHVPLPPYLQREAEVIDQERYQTVYAQQPGSVAAPTAGLHFDEKLLQQLQAHGVQLAKITLHVGAGTFQPVRVEDITHHVMHAEYVVVTQQVCQQIQACKMDGGRVIAVGTTVLRSLETAARSGTIQPFVGDTRLFITPGFKFHCVDVLITNFHLPKSTLLILACAFAGYAQVMAAYQAAIHLDYRFYSYGDAMWIEQSKGQK